MAGFLMSDSIRFEKSLAAKISLLILIFISLFVAIPATLWIIYHYYKNRAHLSRTVMFKTGVCYFTSALLFFINHCCQLLNEGWGFPKYEWIFVCSTVLIYELHFILFMTLSLSRLYYIFIGTQYELHTITVSLFLFVGVIEIFNSSLLIYLIWKESESHLVMFVFTIGIFLVILITFWITLLYIYKLFHVIKNNQSMNYDVKGCKLVQNLIKYTNLALVWITSSICFWCIPFTAGSLHCTLYVMFYHAFMLLDITTNTFTFALTYKFAEEAYRKWCCCTHRVFKVCCIKMIMRARIKLDLIEKLSQKCDIGAFPVELPTVAVPVPDATVQTQVDYVDDLDVIVDVNYLSADYVDDLDVVVDDGDINIQLEEVGGEEPAPSTLTIPTFAPSVSKYSSTSPKGLNNNRLNLLENAAHTCSTPVFLTKTAERPLSLQDNATVM